MQTPAAVLLVTPPCPPQCLDCICLSEPGPWPPSQEPHLHPEQHFTVLADHRCCRHAVLVNLCNRAACSSLAHAPCHQAACPSPHWTPHALSSNSQAAHWPTMHVIRALMQHLDTTFALLQHSGDLGAVLWAQQQLLNPDRPPGAESPSQHPRQACRQLPSGQPLLAPSQVGINSCVLSFSMQRVAGAFETVASGQAPRDGSTCSTVQAGWGWSAVSQAGSCLCGREAEPATRIKTVLLNSMHARWQRLALFMPTGHDCRQQQHHQLR